MAGLLYFPAMTAEKNTPENTENTLSRDFIRTIIDRDLEGGKHSAIVTRFPPEPNGYLHIGHGKSICLNFGLSQEFAGAKCHLRLDDTNPEKEDEAYVKAIQKDVRWLGFDWKEEEFYASDYFDTLYNIAVGLIQNGKAYVCELNADEIREHRGTLKEPGKNCCYRERPIEESLELFEQMKNGDIEEGKCCLRAKIDMSSGNINMRDPVLYRIRKIPHQRAGNKWNIYPMYDFAHPLSDAIEGITHSLCTLEFQDHRPLYNWMVEKASQLGIANLPSVEKRPQQIEFARLNMTFTVMSKRKLLELVQENHVQGWDDPRMPTLSGLRRRGYTPSSIRTFCSKIGLAKRDSIVDVALLESCIREEYNKNALRVMGVINPLKLVIENYPEGESEEREAINNPEDPTAGSRKVRFSKVLYIEQEDFMEDPPKKFFRLGPDREVRLRYGYFVKCTGYDKDHNTGEITEVRCTYDPETSGGKAPDGRKVKGTIHWVSAEDCVEAEVRVYDRLFQVPNPGKSTIDEEGKERDWKENINPNSLQIHAHAKLERSLERAALGDVYQFERLGYFCVDQDSSKNKLVFNRTVGLKDAWAKIAKK